MSSMWGGGLLFTLYAAAFPAVGIEPVLRRDVSEKRQLPADRRIPQAHAGTPSPAIAAAKRAQPGLTSPVPSFTD